MEILKQKFFYNELVPLQSVTEERSYQTFPKIIHYVALDISKDEYDLKEKQYIFCAIYENYIRIVEMWDAYSQIHRRFVAYWRGNDYATAKSSLDLLLNRREYQLFTRIDNKTGKLMVKLEPTTIELPTYTEKDVKDILKEIRIREHSDDIE